MVVFQSLQAASSFLKKIKNPQESPMSLTTLKWGSTFLVLSGILVAQFNIYPLYIFIHSVGALGWMMSGYLMKDKAVMTNFGLQIPIFAIGYMNYFLI